MKTITTFFLTVTLILIGLVGWGQTAFTATYTFTGTTGNVASFAYNGTAVTGVSMGNIVKVGITTSSSSGNSRATDWPLGATLDAGKYIGFNMTAVSGYEFTVTSITFGIGRSAAGTRTSQWRGSHDSYGSTLSNYTTVNSGLTNTSGVLTNPDANSSWTGNVLNVSANYTGVSSAEFRMFMYASETAAGTAGLQGAITINGTYTPVGGSGPIISNIVQTPSTVTLSNTVSVSADVTDADGVGAVELHWGTTAGNLTNIINMSLDSGDTYITDSDIPAQAYGTTVYYEIEAIDNNTNITTSTEQSYYVNYNTCFSDNNNFEKVSIVTNSQNDVWTYSSGTYTMNGYCGTSCSEPSNQWLILGKLDLSSYTGSETLQMMLDATESFTNTDLKIYITSTYTGCPQDAGNSWLLLETLTATVNDQIIDLSVAAGESEVYIGIQYEDSDGAYSQWALSNISIQSDTTCFTIDTPVVSNCDVVVTLNPTSISGFTYVAGSGPSTEQTFTVLGNHLQGNVSLTAPTHYEISTTSGSGFTNSLTLTPAEVATAKTIYVRLKSGLAIGTYNSEIISVSSTNATTQEVTLNGSVTCSTDVLSVSIVASPSGSICSGTEVTFTATPTNGGSSPTYQWKLNGSNVGLNTATYVNSTLADNDEVTCEVTNANLCTSTATSNTLTITVLAPPTTSVAGSNTAICPSETYTLAANTPVVGTGSWSITSGPSTSLSQLSSTTSPTAVFTPAGGNGDYVLTWKISNLPCAASMSSVTITVSGATPTITDQPDATSVCVGNTTNMTVSVTGASDYQWRKKNAGWGSIGAWDLINGNGGFFIGSSTANGGGSSGIDTSSNAWGMWNSGTSTTEAIRDFSVLQVGQVFQVDMDNGWVDGSVGFGLRNDSNQNMLEFYFQGGQSNYTINRNGGVVDSGIPYTANGLTITIEITSATTYSMNVVTLNGGTNYGPFTGTFINTGNITRFRAFSYNNTGGVQRNLYFNNLFIGPSATYPFYEDNAAAYSGWTDGNNLGTAPVSDGATGNGSTYAGTTTTAFSISTTTSLDAGNYDVVVYTNCAGTTSNAAALTVVAQPNAGTISGNASVCVGGNTTYTSDGDSGGSWNSDDTDIATVNATTGEILGIALGSVDIIYTVNNGSCSVQSLKNITVVAVPNAGTLSGTQEVCPTATTTISSNGDTGGTWSSSNTSIATVDASGIVTGVAAGTADIFYTVAGSGGCTDDTSNIEITVLDNPTTSVAGSNQTICFNGTATLAANTPTIGIGTWSVTSGPSLLATQFDNVNSTSATFTPAGGAGSYVLTWTITNSPCTSSSSNVTITVNADLNYGSVSELGTNPNTHLVISQVYGGGGNTGATYKNDFIEIFNPTSNTVDLTGWSVQYTSASGTSWTVTPISGTINPGKYYLVQEAAGAGGTIDLPTPDAIGNIAMSGTACKVALCNNTIALSGAISTGTGTGIIDFIGINSTATGYETAYAPAMSNTTSISRKENGCQDTNDNSQDFTAGTPTPRNSSSSQYLCYDTSLESICSGITPTSMQVSGASGSGSFTYQWYSQTGLVAAPSGTDTTGWTSLGSTDGANTATYAPTSLTTDTTFACFVTPGGTPTCGTGTWASGIRKVDVLDLPIPTLTGNPSTDICLNESVVYTTEASMTDYAWSVSGTLGVDYNITAGGLATTNHTVTLEWLTSGTKSITVNYKNANGCLGASAANVSTVVIPNTTITTHPLTQEICVGESVTFTVVAANSSSYTYTWKHNGNVVGSNSPSLTINPTTSTDAGNYTVEVTGDCGAVVTSNVATLSFTPQVITWANLETPSNGTNVIVMGQDFTIQSQVYIECVTDGSGDDSTLKVWIGYNTTDSNPSGWTNWVEVTAPATDLGNNYRYSLSTRDLLPSVSSGTFYIAARYQYDNGAFVYGGYSSGGGGIWDNTNYFNGKLEIQPISLYGNATGSVELDMYSSDGVHFSTTVILTADWAKFKQNHAWTINWGSSAFPSGTGTQDGANIPVSPAGTYLVTFNRSTGAYNFTNINCTSSITTTWNGTTWDNGTPDMTKKAVFDADYNTTTDPISACECQINADKTVTVADDTYFTISKSIVNNGNLVVESQGNVIQYEATNTNTGTGYKVKKTTSTAMDYDYVYWSSPVSNADIATVFSDNPSYRYQFVTGNFVDLYSGTSYPQTDGTNGDGYDDNGNDWTSASGSMSAGKGYIVMAKGSEMPINSTNLAAMEINPAQQVEFTGGVFNSGDYSMTALQDGTNDQDDYNYNLNFIGNPYPSAISADRFINTNTAVLEGTLYFWTHKTAVAANAGPNAYDFNNADFATYTLSGGVASANGGTIPTGNIASCQGFMASVKETASGNIVFNNLMRLAENNNNFYRQAEVTEKDRLWLKMTGNDDLYRQILVAFLPEATTGPDPLYDGLRMYDETTEDFYSVLNHQKYAIQAYPAFDVNYEIPLGIQIKQAGTYSIDMDGLEGILEGQNVYLEDTENEVIHNLKSSAYTFTSTVGNFDERFILRFTDSALSNEDTTLSQLKIYPNPSTGVFYINYAGSEKLTYTIYDLTGKKVLMGTGTVMDLSTLNSGIYTAQISNTASVRSVKLIRE